MAEPQTDAQRQVEEFNAFNPIGTGVLAYPTHERGKHKAVFTITSSPARVLPCGHAGVSVAGAAGVVHLSHVDVLPRARIVRLAMVVNAHRPAVAPLRCTCHWADAEPKTHALHVGEHLDGLVDDILSEALAPVRELAATQAAECSYEGSHDTCPGHALQRALEATP